MMFYFFANWEARLARMGLLAMLLLTLGPLFGQLSMPKMSAADVISEMPMASHTGHDQASMMLGVSASDTEHHTHMMMSHAWDDACGYCSFLDHFPFLSITVPNIVLVPFQPISARVKWVRSAFYSDSLFLHALKRAPPYL